MTENILETRNLCKEFPGVIALKDINVGIKKSTIHFIVGENGAGKSTFIKIITGAIDSTEGNIYLNGKDYKPNNPREAIKSGISTVFQELNVAEHLTVLQNIILGKEESVLGILKRPSNINRIKEVLKKLEPNIRLKDRLSDLSVAYKQLVEIAKAIVSDANIIIMDEPTAALSEEESNKLLEIVKGLKEQGITIIYVTHKLEEIFQIADYVTILRDGRLIDTKGISEISSKSEIIKMMTGKIVTENYIPSDIDHTKEVLKFKNIKTDRLKDISFSLCQGEIIGFYGVVGSGKTEIANAIYGLDKVKSGEIKIKGITTEIRSPQDAIRRSIALVPEERRRWGLFINLRNREYINYEFE